MAPLLPGTLARLVAVAVAVVLVTYFIILREPSARHGAQPAGRPSFTDKGSRIIVMGRTSDEDTGWVAEHLPDWQTMIYTVDTVNSGTKSVPANKGREAMSYLTYIVEHYDALPETLVFMHPHRSAWHTDAAGQDAVELLAALRLDFVQREGYANLRCQWNPGCPAEEWGLTLAGAQEATPAAKEEEAEGAKGAKEDAAAVLARDWPLLFPDEAMPSQVAGACCSQFAVSKENVVRRPRKDYVRLRHWLLTAGVSDDTKAGVFEHLWQVIFGWDPVTCPKPEKCYCDLYGKCPSLF